jgi:hypothetical protein
LLCHNMSQYVTHFELETQPVTQQWHPESSDSSSSRSTRCTVCTRCCAKLATPMLTFSML